MRPEQVTESVKEWRALARDYGMTARVRTELDDIDMAAAGQPVHDRIDYRMDAWYTRIAIKGKKNSPLHNIEVVIVWRITPVSPRRSTARLYSAELYTWGANEEYFRNNEVRISEHLTRTFKLERARRELAEITELGEIAREAGLSPDELRKLIARSR